MNARDSLLVALPAVLIGLGIGSQLDLFLGEAPDEIAASGPGRRSGSGEPVSPRGSEPAPLVPPSVGNARLNAPSTPAPAPARVSAPELERALEAVGTPKVSATPGASSIRGTVVDEDGAPLAGVAVIGARRVRPSRAVDPSDIGAGPPTDRSLKEYLKDQADTWAESRASRCKVTTGPDGAFALDGLNEETIYYVNAYREGYVIDGDQRTHEVRVGTTLTFRAKRVHEIPIELVTEDGERPADAVIAVERGNRTQQFKWDGEQSVLRLVDGRVGLTGYAGLQPSTGYGGEIESSHRSEKVSLDVIENGGATVRIVLEARSGVRGQVIDPWNTASMHEVKALLLPGDGKVDEKALAQSNQEARAFSGHYALLDLPPGRYAIGLVTRRGEAALAHEIIDIGAGIAELDLEVPEPDASEHLVVRAFGPNGRPLDDVSFNILQKRGGGSSSGGAEARHAPDGAYWISLGTRYTGFFEPWGDETSYTLTARHSELGSREFELVEGQLELEVRFIEPVSIIVIATGLVGSGQEGKVRASVSRVKEGEDEDSSRVFRGRRGGQNDGKLSPEGKARFDGLEPGTWKVGLMAGDNQWQSELIVSREVRVLSGETTVDLAVPVLHSLSVHAPGLAVGSWLSLRAADKKGENNYFNGKNGNLDKDHRVRFDGLVAGQYVLSGNGIREQQEVTVPGGEFFLDVQEPDCMRVSIGDMEGELYKAGLRAGDLIIGVEGKDLASANDVWKHWRAAKGDTIGLSVLRGKERLEFSMPKIEMAGNWFEKLGGMLSPASRK